MAWEAPNLKYLLDELDRQQPGLIHNHLAFCMEFVRKANREGPVEHRGKWGLNGKRGNRHDLSNDIAAYLNSEVPWGCSIVDIIGGADGPNPTTAWIDQTRRTHELGTVGLWVRVEGEPKPEPIPTPEPEPNPNPTPTPIVNCKFDDAAARAAISDIRGLSDALHQLIDEVRRDMERYYIDLSKQIQGTQGGGGSNFKCNFPKIRGLSSQESDTLRSLGLGGLVDRNDDGATDE